MRAARQWQAIGRVRDVRVRRRRAALALAQREVHAAAQALDAARASLNEHTALLPLLAARCEHAYRDAALWRDALTRHRAREAQWRAAVTAAETHMTAALADLARAAAALRRDLLARDDARARVRALQRQAIENG